MKLTADLLRVSTEQELAGCLAVRREVFIVEQQVPENLEVDEFDRSPEACHHILIRMEGRAIAAGRWRAYEGDTVKFQRLAVLREHRGLGLGKLLLDGLEQWAKELGFHQAILDAQTQAEGFYRKAGYRPVSEEIFLDAGMPHVRMKKVL
ncbi:GNAT family N-acetyltransferase [Ferviditalea candida]|uniref:GNAT family N-acetyltransferase n=1 Tax=Ferviditalea candida TaxID=3108399 RepID=A0ABU5ZM65_9BACL|nr:GNAT family N-acetyltransferase [Paenibacillaceae bacterium T2]